MVDAAQPTLHAGGGMKPLAELDTQGIAGVLLDIDDTLTTDGKLTAAAYTALERLKRSGLRVVPVTGRPAGWCDHMARMWPVDAVVGENGAFYFWHDGRRLHRRYGDAPAVREVNRARLRAVAADIVAHVPGCAVAADQAYRETDLAIDYCEDVVPLSLEAAERIAQRMREAGMTAKVSSIHVNGWFGEYDKLGMTRALFVERFSIDLEAQRQSVVFVGDSPNDVPMFRFFPRSVGVANLRRFASALEHPPAFITARPCGDGFAELVAHLLGRQ